MAKIDAPLAPGERKFLLSHREQLLTMVGRIEDRLGMARTSQAAGRRVVDSNRPR